MNHGNAEARRDDLDRLTHRVIGCCIEVHRELGPGLLESVYEDALAYELSAAGLAFSRQHAVPILYKGRRLSGDFRLDLYVEQRLVVELKAVSELLPIHQAQVLTYLRLLPAPLGLLINFNVSVLRDGIRRLILS